jgi:cytoskeletal protein CcmA (bactofilin family)
VRRHRFVLLAGGALLFLCVCAGLAAGASLVFGSWRPCGGAGSTSANVTIPQAQTVEDVRACGGNVTVFGHVDGNIDAYGGRVNVASSGSVDGDVTSYGGHVEVAGLVDGDVTSYGGGVTLDSTTHITGDVLAYGGSITRSPGAAVEGSINLNHPTNTSFTNNPFFNPFNFTFPVVSIVIWVLLAAVLAHWFPQRTFRVGEVMFSRLPRSLAVGALSWVLGLILAGILALTIVGIPLALAIVVVLAVGGVMGNVAIGWLIGRGVLRRFTQREASPMLEAAVGVAILVVLESVPFVGFLLSIFIALLGVGAALLSRFGSNRWGVPSLRRPAA